MSYEDKDRIDAHRARLKGKSVDELRAEVIAAAREWRAQPDLYKWNDAVERLLATVDALNAAERDE